MKRTLSILLLSCALYASAQTFTTYTEEDGLLDNTALCVTLDSDNNPWFGTQNGIAFFDDSNWMSYTEDDGLIHNTVWAICMDSQGVLWAGTDFGISAFDGDSWTTYTTDDGLEDNRIKHIYEANNGVMWFGNNDGVSSFDGSSFTNYTMDDGLPFGGVAHVNQDLDGNMWFGTSLGGAYKFDGTNWEVFSTDEGLITVSVRSIATDLGNKKWIACNEGISVFASDDTHLTDHLSIIELPAPHEINPVTDVKIDSEERVWAAVYVDYLVSVGGVGLYDGGVWTDFDVDDGLAGPDVNQLAIDANDDVWVATGSGVTKITDVPLNIESPIVNSTLSAFPNPSTGVVNIDVVADEKVIEVFTAQGQMAYRQEVIKVGLNRLDLQHLPNGTYFIKVGARTSRIIVLK